MSACLLFGSMWAIISVSERAPGSWLAPPKWLTSTALCTNARVSEPTTKKFAGWPAESDAPLSCSEPWRNRSWVASEIFVAATRSAAYSAP